MVAFPSSLPLARRDSLEVGGVDPWVSDPSEVGAPRRRKRYTRSLKTFDFHLELTKAELAVLVTFYDETLSDGVDSFTWTNPADDTVYTVRFVQRFTAKSMAPDLYDVTIGLVEQ